MPHPLHVTSVLLALAVLTAAQGAVAVTLTGPPAPEHTVSTQTVCVDLVTGVSVDVTINGEQVGTQAVCATATATMDWSCVLDGPAHTLCTMMLTLTGGGSSPAQFPGAYTWGGGAGAQECDGNPDTGPSCLAVDARWYHCDLDPVPWCEKGSWPGLLQGSQASNGALFGSVMRMPLNTEIDRPNCYHQDVGGGLFVTARAVDALGNVYMAEAGAGNGMWKDFSGSVPCFPP